MKTVTRIRPPLGRPRPVLALVLLLALALSSFGSAAAQGTPEVTLGASPVASPDASPIAITAIDKVALITPASRTNYGWDQQAADNIEAVGQALGLDVEVVENAGYEDPTPILRDLAEGGADLIICHASGYQTTCPEFAQETGTKVAVIENQAAVTPGLISDIETQAQEVAYLAGVLAGNVTKTNTVGVVVSGEPPTWNYMTVGFAEGLKASKPDATMLYSVIGEAAYDDAARAKRVTEQQLAANADVIFGMGDGASFGMIQAIDEHNAEGGDKAWFIDVIGDKTEIDQGKSLLSSVLFDYRGIYRQMIEDIERDQFGKVYVMNVKNEGVRLLDVPAEIGEDAKKAVEDARRDIVDNKITVSAIAEADKMKARVDELFPR